MLPHRCLWHRFYWYQSLTRRAGRSDIKSAHLGQTDTSLENSQVSCRRQSSPCIAWWNVLRIPSIQRIRGVMTNHISQHQDHAWLEIGSCSRQNHLSMEVPHVWMLNIQSPTPPEVAEKLLSHKSRHDEMCEVLFQTWQSKAGPAATRNSLLAVSVCGNQ